MEILGTKVLGAFAFSSLVLFWCFILLCESSNEEKKKLSVTLKTGERKKKVRFCHYEIKIENTHDRGKAVASRKIKDNFICFGI